MFQSVDIGQAGEKLVAGWLRSKGYAVEQNTQLPGAADIEAIGNPTSLLVQVKSALHPSQPAFLDANESSRIQSRANRLGWQAWLARLQLDRQGNLLGEILWSKLN